MQGVIAVRGFELAYIFAFKLIFFLNISLRVTFNEKENVLLPLNPISSAVLSNLTSLGSINPLHARHLCCQPPWWMTRGILIWLVGCFFGGGN